jgi:hypothetical protein
MKFLSDSRNEQKTCFFALPYTLLIITFSKIKSSRENLEMFVISKFIFELIAQKHHHCISSFSDFGKGSSIIDVTALGGMGYQGFCDYSAKALVLKSVTMGEGVSKIINYCMMSFMDISKKFTKYRSVTSTRGHILKTFLRKFLKSS